MIGASNLSHTTTGALGVDAPIERPATTSVVVDKLVQLSKAFDKRTKAVKAELIRTQGESFQHDSTLPSVGDSDDEDKKGPDAGSIRFAPSATPIQTGKISPFLECHPEPVGDDEAESILWGTIKRGVVDTSTALYRFWLMILSLTFLYNFWSITLRESFQQFRNEDTKTIGWLVFDYLCDVVVLCDIIFVKPRIAFYENGLVVYDKKVLRKAYLTSTKFKIDVIAMLPLDLCYLAVGRIEPLFRLPRLLNVRYYFEMFDRLDRHASLPELFRMLKTVIYILMTVHLYTCVYFLFSERVIGIGHDKFVYEGEPWPVYARCFFVTFKMATRIGGQEKEPHTNSERGLMALFWLIALFVEIVLLAQVREIFLSVTKEDDEFGLLLSTALAYVRRYKCPVEIEKKVRDWFTYTRETQKALDEQDVLKLLPKHLRTDLAFDIHYALLSKVSIFENCERAVLSDVVVKLKVEMFFPNDIIYKKGDVGKQMYIIEKGQAEVVDDNGGILATLTEGAVFGERSLLSLGTSNRRHVTVRSKGYSNLFVLSKDDFQEIMVHHPKLYRRLRKKAMSVPDGGKIVSSLGFITGEQTVADIAPVQAIVNVVQKVPRPSTPKILRLMMKILPGRSSVIRRMIKVHPSPRDDFMFDVESADYDPEIAALHWSSPSPDEFYVHQEWELRHYKVRPPTPVKQEVEDAEESVFDSQVTSADATMTKSQNSTSPSSQRKNTVSKVSDSKQQQQQHKTEQMLTATTVTFTTTSSTETNFSQAENTSKGCHKSADVNAVKTAQAVATSLKKWVDKDQTQQEAVADRSFST